MLPLNPENPRIIVPLFAPALGALAAQAAPPTPPTPPPPRPRAPPGGGGGGAGGGGGPPPPPRPTWWNCGWTPCLCQTMPPRWTLCAGRWQNR